MSPDNWRQVGGYSRPDAELRQATPADGQFVYDVTEAAMREYVERALGPWVESFQRDVIGKSFDPGTHQIILFRGEAAGIVAASRYESHIQLEKLYVLPRFQRHEIGSSIVVGLQQVAATGRKPIHLRVLAVNLGAQRLYQRLGFIVAKRTSERIYMEYHP